MRPRAASTVVRTRYRTNVAHHGQPSKAVAVTARNQACTLGGTDAKGARSPWAAGLPIVAP